MRQLAKSLQAVVTHRIALDAFVAYGTTVEHSLTLHQYWSILMSAGIVKGRKRSPCLPINFEASGDA
jgi:hypothetical protein